MDRPRYGRLGLVVGVCFILGAAWPSVAGLKFVQRPPGSTPAKAEELEPLPGDTDPEPSPAPTSDTGLRAAAHLKPALSSLESVRLGESTVASCQDDQRQAVAVCDRPNLLGLIEEPVAKLARCDAAEGVSGMLSLGLELNFERGHVTRVKAGQSTTLSKAKTALLVACAEDVVVGTPLGNVAHEHAAYWLYYQIQFLPPGTPMTSGAIAAEVIEASGQATVGWKTAVVRDGPSREANISAKLLYGTRIEVTGRLGDWYRVNHDGKNVGWLHRKAIGM
jgi:SH3 domain-containing protein